VNISGPGVKAINMIVHDNGGNGFGVWSQAPDAEVYGSVVYNNGRQRVTSGYAHGIYTQNDQGSKLFQDNIVFHQFGYGIHAYAEEGSIAHMTFDGNVSFDNGVGTTDPEKAQPDLFVGGMTPLRDVTITNNMTWHVGYGGGSVWIGYASCRCTGAGVVLQHNYFVGGTPVLRLESLAGVRATWNTLVGPGRKASIIEESGAPAEFFWRGNIYYGDETEREFQWDGDTYTFAAWRSSTGFGARDGYGGPRPVDTRVFVRPNRYEPGRANVVVYDWDGTSSVSVDLSNVLQPGDAYEIRNVQSWFAAPVAAGVYTGALVPFPMTPVVPPAPQGGWVVTPPLTEPRFGAFVVLRR
ncbi:MAG TPA: right-handed parallel beta-helix repeat-containing protein, partial [Gemmatimonadaceae bacterium]|nr:right-handed parallel beta-helix repeat-containing protein [Gemmatimonadaceae bacterium]